MDIGCNGILKLGSDFVSNPLIIETMIQFPYTLEHLIFHSMVSLLRSVLKKGEQRTQEHIRKDRWN